MLPVYFAPLQGFTEAPYRRIHNEVCGGVVAYYTPFIRLEHGQIRKKDLREALPENNVGVRVVPQVIASDASEFVTLAKKLIEVGHKVIDVNMGCPFPLQTRLGRGSGILQHTDKAVGILHEVENLQKEVEGLRFSVKMRLGQESPEECFALIDALNALELEHITLHPRVGRDQYRGELDMESFGRFYEASANPIVFNGMLASAEDIAAVEKLFPKLAGVMIGRGLLSRPTLAWEYSEDRHLTDDEVRQKVLDMHRCLLAHYETAIEGGEKQLVMKMHSFWEYLEPLFGHKTVKKIMKSGSLRNYREAVANC